MAKKRRRSTTQRNVAAKGQNAAPRSKRARAEGGRRFDPALWPCWLLLLLPAFAFLPGVSDSFRLPKLMISEVLALVACAALALRLWGRERVEALGWVRSAAARIGLPLLAIAAIGLWTSDHPGFVRRTLPALAAGLLFLWMATELLDAAERCRLLRFLVVPAAALSVLALLQALDLWQPLGFQGNVTERLSVTSLAGGVFDLAAFLFLPLLLSVERVVETRGSWRWTWAGAVVLLGSALLATQTLVTLGATVIAVLLYAWRRVPRPTAWRAAVALVVGLVVVILAVAPLRTRIVNKGEKLARGDVNALLTGRLDGWRTAVWMASEHPLDGVGLGAFRAEFGDAKLALVEQRVRFYEGHAQAYFVNAHSDPLEAVAEWGLPGAVGLIWAVFLLCGAVRRGSPGLTGHTGQEDDSSSLHLLILPVLVGMAVISLANFPFRLALVAYPWLLFLSGVLATGSAKAADDASGEQPDSQESAAARATASVAWPAKPVATALCVLFLVSAFLAFQRGRDRLGALRLVTAAEAIVQQGIQAGRMPPQALDAILDVLRRAEELDPVEVSVPMTRGVAFALAGRTDAAERAYKDALRLENRPEIWGNLARLYLQAGERKKAIHAGGQVRALDRRIAQQLTSLPEIWGR